MIVIKILLVFLLAIQLFYYLKYFLKLSLVKRVPDSASNDLSVSVVICVKNDLENIKRSLPLILNQDYPQFEVVVVNDGNDEETAQFLTQLKESYTHLHPVNLENEPRNYAGKKEALIKGIERVQFDWVLLTDADCCPKTNRWIQHMADSVADQTEVMLGYGPLNEKGGFLNKFARFETYITALQYFSFAKSGLPYMGVGRNLMYKKSAIQPESVFEKYKNEISGDDDLLVQSVANKSNIAMSLHPDSFMYSDAASSLWRWLKQKRRHLSVGTHYPWSIKWRLSLWVLATSLFYLLLPILAVSESGSTWIMGLLGVKLLSLYLIHSKPMRLLDVDNLWAWIPALEIVYLIYYIVIAPLLLLRKPKTWQ